MKKSSLTGVGLLFFMFKDLLSSIVGIRQG